MSKDLNETAEAGFVKDKEAKPSKKRRLSTSAADPKKKVKSEETLAWTEKDDYTLKVKVKKHGQNWSMIANYFPGRSSLECFNRWFEAHQPKKGQWTKAEDEQLIKRVKSFPVKSWGEVAAGIVGRTAKQCRERWCYNLDPSINKSIWTPEEDQIIIRTQALKGNRWAHIASLLPGRTENAVKTRFKSILRAKRREWTPEEDAMILKMQQEIGCQWETIAKSIPNRTKNAVKIRFRALSKGMKQQTPKLGAPNQAIHNSALDLPGKKLGMNDSTLLSSLKPSDNVTPLAEAYLLAQAKTWNQNLMGQVGMNQLGFQNMGIVGNPAALLLQQQLLQAAEIQANLMAKSTAPARQLLTTLLPYSTPIMNQVGGIGHVQGVSVVDSHKEPGLKR